MLRNEPQWYKDAIIYQLHVRAYHDSLGDGRGDFRGLTQKLDYVQDLGVTAIWLLPFYPSPLRDDGYDIADYTTVHPDYGTLEMFREFLEAAHGRGLRVITELVINHTSDQHPWFQRARRAPSGSVERDFYVWSDTPERYTDARIIFKDFEVSNWTYDHVAKAYFWHRFYSHQPDLNYDNPEVHRAIFPLLDFWFDLGVDGLRLDAVPYLYEREDTNCENLPETHDFLKALRRHVDERYPDRMLLAEANQWPEDAAAYFGAGDECHMAFHFPVMPRLYMAVHTEDRFPIVDILQQTPAIPENCQWAIFLRNHDELTLEMVTDEERDYMYRAYALERRARINLGIRRRLAPLLGNNRRRIELMNGLLFSLPGTPVLYYGDEIGMGDNIYLGDRNGVRTPMQWSADRNAGFSRANPQKLYLPIIIDPEYHYEAVNVEAQQGNPSSLLWWHKRLMSLRQQHKAFSRGEVEFLDPHNRKILAFVRRHEDDRVLVVANLSRFVQFVELNLSQFEGVTPVELFGSTQFPPIGKLPYLLTLGPHAFYWFALPGTEKPAGEADGAPVFHTLDAWERLFERPQATRLANSLLLFWQRHLARGTRPREVRAVKLRDVFRFVRGDVVTRLVIADFEFKDGGPETVALPLRFAPEAVAAAWPAGVQPNRLARLAGPEGGIIYDASAETSAAQAIVDAIAQRRSAAGEMGGELRAWTTDVGPLPQPGETDALAISVHRTAQTNQSVVFGKHWILKQFRRVEEGVHPEVEIGRRLSVISDGPKLAPTLLGGIDYRRHNSEPTTTCVLHEYVVNDSDAWRYTLDVLDNLLDQLSARPSEARHDPPVSDVELNGHVDEKVRQLLGGYWDMAERLGAQVARLHLALSSRFEQSEFSVEPFSPQYQRSLYQTSRKQMLDALDGLRHASAGAGESLRELIGHVIALRSRILERFQPLLGRTFETVRARIHGDLHLAQVLLSGREIVFIDFEGIASHSLGERRIKRSPLRDVVGMLRSFDYAAQCALLGLGSDPDQAQGGVREADRASLEPWLEFWRRTTATKFLAAYLAVPRIGELIPQSSADLHAMIDVLCLEQMTVEIRHELQHRPDWLVIPLRSLIRTLS